MSFSRSACLLLVASLSLGIVGCNVPEVKTGPMRTDPLSIDLGNAERANIELDIGAGELNVKGGADNLISGAFKYNADALKPIIDSSRNGSHAVVTIKQNSGHSMGGRVHNEWNLQLNSKTLLDLAVNCGAGENNLDLHDVSLRSLNVHMGAGQVDVDLRGHPTKDYEVEISGGVGQATVHLPQDVGIRAEASGGLGSVDVKGLEKVGDHYQNALYDKAKVNLRIKVQGGIGQINLLGA